MLSHTLRRAVRSGLTTCGRLASAAGRPGHRRLHVQEHVAKKWMQERGVDVQRGVTIGDPREAAQA